MATHHGRPGGRLLEVGLALGLVVLSAAFLMVWVAVPIYVLKLLSLKGGRIGKAGAVWIMLGFFLLKYPWNALLKYYRYEAHTLRPIKEDRTHERNAD